MKVYGDRSRETYERDQRNGYRSPNKPSGQESKCEKALDQDDGRRDDLCNRRRNKRIVEHGSSELAWMSGFSDRSCEENQAES